MVDSFEALANNIMNTRQNIISLTEGDYDPTPIVVIIQQNVTLKKNITIEKSTLKDGYHYWGEAGIKWGDVGLVYADDSTTFTAYATIENIVNTGYNNFGFATMIDSTKSLFDYLAYGSGVVTDNATALTAEIGRVTTPVILEGDNYFNLQFTIDASTDNGNIFKEYGLATADVGDISSTVNFAEIEKTALIFVLADIKNYFRNYGDVTWANMRLNDGGITSIVDLIYDDWGYLRLGDSGTTYSETDGTVADGIGTISVISTKDSNSYTRIGLLSPLDYSGEDITKLFDSIALSGTDVESYEPVTGISNKTLVDRYKITIRTDVIR